MNQLRETLSQYWLVIQGSLFPWLKEDLGELTEKQQQLVMTLELVRLEEFLSTTYGLPGDRTAIVRAFIAKMVYSMPTTTVLIDRLKSDPLLRRLCGWERKSAIPGEWTFSWAFAKFAESRLPERVHEVLEDAENELPDLYRLTLNLLYGRLITIKDDVDVLNNSSLGVQKIP